MGSDVKSICDLSSERKLWRNSSGFWKYILDGHLDLLLEQEAPPALRGASHDLGPEFLGPPSDHPRNLQGEQVIVLTQLPFLYYGANSFSRAKSVSGTKATSRRTLRGFDAQL